jgi:hypothetical protein
MQNKLTEKMNDQDKLVKEQLIEHLIENGYGTYAKRLKEFYVYVAEIFNGIPIGTAAMFPNTGDIVINPGFFDLPDEKQAWDQLSVLVRHEILHFLLVHEKRLFDHLVATDPNFEESYKKASIHQIANYAMDWELSDVGYDEHDKEVVRIMTLNGEVIGGLILSDDHPEWINKPMEELFELVKKEVEAGRIKLPPPDNSGGSGGGNGGGGPSPEYADGWNAIMAKFDDPNVSEQELQDLINQISSGQLTSI